MNKTWRLAVMAFALAGVLPTVNAGGRHHQGEERSRPVRATASITGCTDPYVSGDARLVERPSDEGVKLVEVRMRIKGLPDGTHAVHIHETGACSPTCGAAGGHFDPGPNSNPSPDGNHPFHAGDLINIEVKHGRGYLKTTTSRITLSPGPLSVFDEDESAFIVHVDPDTYCPEGATAGCAGGARAACGVIERVSNDEDDWLD